MKARITLKQTPKRNNRKKRTGIILILFLCIGLTPGSLFGWGVWAHEHINRAAIFALPEPLRSFYFNHNDFITIQASVPDLRKHLLSLKAESARHFFNTEAYGNDAFSGIPKLWQDAEQKYGSKVLYKNGILPWYIQLITKKLTKAFKSGNKVDILLLSSDLAHYVGDGYQPLHTTTNYDGQLTGQKGIHSLFESKLPDLFGCHYNLKTAPAGYFKNISDVSWQIIEESHAQLNAVLGAEQSLLPAFSQNGKTNFSKAFCKAYNDKVGGLIQSQLQKAIYTTASLWYTAWVNAGKPDVSQLDDASFYKINQKELRKEYKEWQHSGKLIRLKS